MKNIKVSPSILSCDFSKMGEELKTITDAGADWAHIDVMDGMFVPNLTLGPCIIKAIRPCSEIFFDVHLMIEKPERYIDEFFNAGADLITIHYEATENPTEVIDKIHEVGCVAGISIKPGTPVSVLEPIIEKVDLVLIMSVEPGFGGQKFMPIAVDKIAETKAMCQKHGVNPYIEVDGGISPANVKSVLDAGCTAVVAGSAVFKSDDMAKTIKELRG